MAWAATALDRSARMTRMLISRFACARFGMVAAALTMTAILAASASAQGLSGPPITFKVKGANERMEMIVSTSRILKLDQKIPRFVVNNPDLIKVVPLSATELQVAAIKPGVTQINLWTESGEIFSVDMLIFGDARELSTLLESQFPRSSLKVRPLSNSVVISGYVDQPDHVSRIIRMAEDYYPKVINNITVGGVQQVLLHCKVMEVSRTKMRAMGFDFQQVSNAGGFVVSSVSGLISAAAINTVGGGNGANLQFGIIGSDSFFGFLEAMRRYNLIKTISEPTLVTVSGRPAYFEVGGEVPYEIPQSLGTTTIEFKAFGTRLDFVPIVLGNGAIRLEVRPRVSSLDESIGIPVGNRVVPGFKKRELDTGVELRAGQTLALAGLLEHRVEAENKGLPFLADLPWFGAAFRRVEEEVNEIELLVLVTPELVDGMDPNEVPQCGPGMSSVSPRDIDLYFRGHLEVPRCDGQCGMNGCGNGCNTDNIPGGLGDSSAEEVAPAPGQAPSAGNPPTGNPPPGMNGARNGNGSGTGTVLRMKSSSATATGARNYKNASTSTNAANGSAGNRAYAGDMPQYPSQPSADNRYSSGASITPMPARDRYNPQSTENRSTEAPRTNPSQGPGLIGPMGYDDVE
jgi:pilus assembly protein CpaC